MSGWGREEGKSGFFLLTTRGCLSAAGGMALLMAQVGPVLAAETGAPHLDGRTLGLGWVAPFAGVLLSIALLPLLTPSLWHHHFGKVAAGWGLAFLLPFAVVHGVELAIYEVVHTALLEYIPFIILLTALFTVAGGVRVSGTLAGTPAVNTALLAGGTCAASLMGTTGAAMLFIRPLLRANSIRRYRQHTVVFFIFLVANIGGALTPLGDPPLFLGFLKGVDFFWPTLHLAAPTGVAVAVLLILYWGIDTALIRHERVLSPAVVDKGPQEPLTLEGWINLPLLLGILATVMVAGVWRPGISLTVYHVTVPLESVVSNGLLLLISALSLRLTPQESRLRNGFSWGPILEVAKLFAAIFLTIIPAIAILRAGSEGALAGVVALVTGPDGQPVTAMYFWACGLLSSVLDNAPTYLVFFNTAGGDAAILMENLPLTLAALSAGAVYMGANTYIGNAPNFMVKSIAEERGVVMPSFFGYMLWSGGILLPLFGVLTVLFFWK